MKVLLVDDDEFALKVVSTRLRKEGIETVIFERGKEALEYLDGTETPPEVILLDIIVPDINGFELLSEIRKRQKMDKSKIYIYSSLSTEADKEKALSRGASGYFSKKYEGFESLVKKIVALSILIEGKKQNDEKISKLKQVSTEELSKNISKRIAMRGAKREGFSLIELLVVIAIIGILAIIPTVNFQIVREQKDDDQRINSLNLLHGAIKLMIINDSTVLANLNLIPRCTTGTPCLSTDLSANRSIDGTGWLPINFKAISPAPIDNLPIDPKNTSPFIFKFVTDGTDYELGICLKSTGRQNKFAANAIDNGDNDKMYEVGTKLTLINNSTPCS